MVVTFSASAFHFLIVHVHADEPTQSKSADFLCMTEVFLAQKTQEGKLRSASHLWLRFTHGSCVGQ